MTRTAQKARTLFQQGFADGRKGRPFRYNKPTKRRRGMDGRPGPRSHAFWFYTEYRTGYRLGQESLKRTWLERVHIPEWLGQVSLLLLSTFITVCILALW